MAAALCMLPASASVTPHCDEPHVATAAAPIQAEEKSKPSDQQCLEHAAHHCSAHAAIVFPDTGTNFVPILLAKSPVGFSSDTRLIRRVLDGPERPPRA
jgi:hypothetical protein